MTANLIPPPHLLVPYLKTVRGVTARTRGILVGFPPRSSGHVASRTQPTAQTLLEQRVWDNPAPWGFWGFYPKVKRVEKEEKRRRDQNQLKDLRVTEQR